MKTLEQVLVENPTLRDHGFNYPGYEDDETVAVYHFDRAVRFLRGVGKVKHISGSHSGSYGLKHQAEAWVEANCPDNSPGGSYVSNGGLIAAALALGFTASHHHGPNCMINYSLKDLRLKRRGRS